MAAHESRPLRLPAPRRSARPALAALLLLPALVAGGEPALRKEAADAPAPKGFVRFAAVGEGDAGTAASASRERVGRRIRSWAPDFVIVLGGDDRRHDFTRGPVHVFSVDSDTGGADGVSRDGRQAQWLRKALAASPARWKIVHFRVPPYSSADRNASRAMRWPFREWGADAVISGRDPHYERLEVDGLAYFVNGLGGDSIRPVGQPLAGSRCVFDEDHGALLVEADWDRIEFRFVTADGVVVDAHTLRKPSVARAEGAAPSVLPAPAP